MNTSTSEDVLQHCRERSERFRLRMLHLNLLSEDGQDMSLCSHEIALISNLCLLPAYEEEDKAGFAYEHHQEGGEGKQEEDGAGGGSMLMLMDLEDLEDELKSLIPSLDRYSSEQMEDIITVMRENVNEFTQR